MTFLGKIRDMFGGGEPEAASPETFRNRTFSAAQFREEELARSAEARARAEAVQIDAAQVLSPAVNPIAENLMDAEAELQEAADAETPASDDDEPPVAEAVEPQASDAVEPPASAEVERPAFDEVEPSAFGEVEPSVSDEVEPQSSDEVELSASDVDESAPSDDAEPTAPVAAPAPPAPPVPVGDPMPWDEAVGWLSQRSAETRNFVGQYWNWDHDLRVLHFLAQQPDLDAGVAAHIFWLTAASEDYFPFGDDEPEGDVAGQVAWLTHFIGRRFAEDAFRPASYGFDDSWDCDRLKQHLVSLHEEGRLEWSPEAIPTSSQAELMSFDDIPEDERAEVMEFLARFGVC